MTRHEQLLYAAGLFDGEGCITLSKDKRQHTRFLKLSLGSTSHSLVLFMQEAFGGNVRGPHIRNNRSKPIYEWFISNRKAAEILVELVPYMLEVRKVARGRLVVNELLPLMGSVGVTLTEDQRKHRIEIEERILAI